MTLLSACSNHADEVVMPGQEISVFSRASEGDASESAHLLFWLNNPDGTYPGDFSAFLNDDTEILGNPYTTADMPNEIDAYKLYNDGSGTPFNTFKPYPSPISTYVYAVGFAPSNAYDKTFDNSDPNRYKKIAILDSNQDGLTDFLASNNDGKCKGSYQNPFIKENDVEYNLERVLKFRHLTACISFMAIRDSSMYNKVGVKDITIEIVNEGDSLGKNKLSVPISIVTYHNAAKAWTYVAGDEIKPDTLKGFVPGEVVKDEGKQLAEFFVNTEGISYGVGDGQFEPFNGLNSSILRVKPTLKVNITATLFWIQDPRQSRKVRYENLKVKEWDVAEGNIATGDRFLPGYKYVVTLRFKNTSIGLRAVQVPWEPGGTYYYPVWDEDESEPGS